MSSIIVNNAGYEIRFKSLFKEGRGLAFPCDAKGHVNLDDLSDAARNNYLYARALVGREFGIPDVQPSEIHMYQSRQSYRSAHIARNLISAGCQNVDNKTLSDGWDVI